MSIDKIRKKEISDKIYESVIEMMDRLSPDEIANEVYDASAKNLKINLNLENKEAFIETVTKTRKMPMKQAEYILSNLVSAIFKSVKSYPREKIEKFVRSYNDKNFSMS